MIPTAKVMLFSDIRKFFYFFLQNSEYLKVSNLLHEATAA